MFTITWLLLTMILATAIACLSRHFGKELLIGAFVGSLVIAIVIAGKLGVVGFGIDAGISASLFIFSMTFVFTDVMAELHGPRFARLAVFSGACCYPIIFLSTYFASKWEPHPFYANQEEFATIMSTTMRVVIASAAAYVVGQFHDIWAFEFWRRKTKGRHLWIRNNLSTMASQLLDTVTFYSIAFYGVFPIGELIVVTYLLKLVIAALDTPFVYFACWYISRGRPRSGDFLTSIPGEPVAPI